MFMSTRYKKKDPEWRKKSLSLFSVDDSLTKLLECLSIEYSVNKLISPKWKNFRSQKLKFESKTRINNAIWRAWHIQYKGKKRPRFCQFDSPFSDLTIHSTTQAVILEGKSWKRRLDSVSREYKKWRKFYNVKILKGAAGVEEKDNLKEISNENSEDEFVSDDEEEDNDGRKLRLSPTKVDKKAMPPPSQLFGSKDGYLMDTFLADVPDTLFSSIRPVQPASDSMGLTFTDLSDMIQPTLDQLNPCFDELLDNFDFLTADWANIQNNTRGLETGEQLPTSMPHMMDIDQSATSMSSALLNDRMYSDPLGNATRYLYSSEVLYTPNSSVMFSKEESTIDTMKPMLADESADEGLQFSMGGGLQAGKREISDRERDITGVSPPRKLMIKELENTTSLLDTGGGGSARFGRSMDFPTQGNIGLNSTMIPAEPVASKSTDFEALLSNAISSSSSQTMPSNIIASQTAVPVNFSSNQTDLRQDQIMAPVGSATQVVQHKMLINQTATTKVVEYSELPPQLQAPNLTAHLQAVMSTRTNNAAMPRNKSDTQLHALHTRSLAEKFASPSNPVQRKDSGGSLPARVKRANRLPRNMSDTNLAQMAKDSSCRLYTRRRLSSISVDTKPLLLPKNFSDTNLAALARGMPRRPQPILPKNLIAIVPPAQARTAGAITRVAITQVDTVVAQTTVSEAQFTTFMVNKQMPCSSEPVKVTLYMPKGKQTTPATMPLEPVASSMQPNTFPQRVEVIQYQGHTAKNASGVSEAAIAPPFVNAPIQPTPNLQGHSVATHKDSSVVSQRSTYATLSSTHATSASHIAPALSVSTTSNVGADSLSSLVQKANGLNRQSVAVKPQEVGLTPSNIQAVAALDLSTPAAMNVDKAAEPIAPLQGLSETQLVNLAQILQGSRSGNVGQETTIAYLETLQKQLNTLLVQQQEILKVQNKDPVSSISTSSIISSMVAPPVASQSVFSQASQLDLQAKAHTVPSLQKGSSQATAVRTAISQVEINVPEVASAPKHNIKIIPDKPSKKDITEQSLIKNQIQVQDAPKQALQSQTVAKQLPQQQHRQQQQKQQRHQQSQHQQQHQQQQQQQQQTFIENTPTEQPISTQVFMPRGITTNSTMPHSSHTPIPRHPASRQLSSLATATLPDAQTPSAQPMQAHSIPLTREPAGIFPHYTTLQQQQKIAQQQQQQQQQQELLSLQHQVSVTQSPIIIGVQALASAPQLSTVDTSMINIAINQPITDPNNHLKHKSQSAPAIQDLSGGQATGQGKPGDQRSGSPRPTMVDLAIAASQRSYLMDKTANADASSAESSPGPLGGIAVVQTLVQAIPTVVISDTSSVKGEAGGQKKSRLRFEDRESYREYRRKNHVTAEQKRRGLIKIAFEQMMSLIPSLREDKQGRMSKALILQKGADYIEHLHRDRELAKFKIDKMRSEVNRLNEEIRRCQEKLPACGATDQLTKKSAKTSYLEHVRERIAKDQNYWLYSVMIRPLFESFQENTVTQTLQEFIQSVLKWFDENCQLPILRPAVIATLRQISTDTPILQNPSLLPSQALQAINSPDPTSLSSQLKISSLPAPEAHQAPSNQAASNTTQIRNVEGMLLTQHPIRWIPQTERTDGSRGSQHMSWTTQHSRK
eukprot:Seg1566.8 transcript_id=Seg1566.8/GoldUCD/mRNA.D3Y31 product="Carbohydrate-responsive element-binding protein" protein_id=Seg1566.8/GoldUCD/D3Y31